MEKLFKTRTGQWATTAELAAALKSVGAHDCQVLYMHTGLAFGTPNPDLRRTELLAAMYETIRASGVPTLCVPTFTFSFCNGEDYDLARSKSRMGALNEYIRQRPEAIRSVDPLMSVAMVGTDRELVENLGRESIGAHSTFDKLSRRDGVKFLFLGVLPGDCFTYMHHLEWRARVPYRYHRDFRGRITAGGRTYEDTYSLFVRYHGVTPNTASHGYARRLEERGILKSTGFGDHWLQCFPEPEARAAYLEILGKDGNFFIEQPFQPNAADRTFEGSNMVSL